MTSLESVSLPALKSLAKGYFDEIDARLGLQGEDKTKIEYVGGQCRSRLRARLG